MSTSTSVNIKMYKVGELGDCFLLRFNAGSEQSHVLIDCGSFRNGGDSVSRMKDIASDIKIQIGNAKLDVIVGTHQHNDHLSGFVHAQKIFESIKPEQVWLSWLDDPNDTQAQQIGKDYNSYLTSLRLINKELGHEYFSANKIHTQVEDILGFFGVEKDKKLPSKTDKLPPALPSEAREILKTIGRKIPAYLSPGKIFDLPGIEEGLVKVYVLGPPKNEDQLYDDKPSKDETFDPKLAINSISANKLLLAMKKYTGGIKEENDQDPFPFNEPFRKSKNYDAAWDSYYSKKEAWRQIDMNWLNQAEQLALWLDNFTNNSSLVLAFEIVKTNKVLLFAADAQTGNWNSWKTIKWKNAPAGFTWLNLIQNTVLYKTGHHGSHNSTLVEGLNNMTHDELVVLIPVDKTDGNIKKKNGWKMPATNLFKQLKIRSQNRIIRMDEGVLPSSAWTKVPFKPKENALYIEYEVRG